MNSLVGFGPDIGHLLLGLGSCALLGDTDHALERIKEEDSDKAAASAPCDADDRNARASCARSAARARASKLT